MANEKLIEYWQNLTTSEAMLILKNNIFNGRLIDAITQNLQGIDNSENISKLIVDGVKIHLTDNKGA